MVPVTYDEQKFLLSLNDGSIQFLKLEGAPNGILELGIIFSFTIASIKLFTLLRHLVPII